MSLARSAARGAAWNFATVLCERAFGFLILGILLRTIPAAVVGLVAIGSAISDLARIVAASGAGEQVQASPGDRAVEAGAFWSQALVSAAFMVVLFVVSPWVAGLYHEPRLVLVLRLMAVNVFLTSFLIVPAARLASRFEFRTVGLISFGSTISGGLVALPFAFAGQGVDALVYQRMVGIGFFAVLVSIFAAWVPPRPPSWAVLRRGFAFSFPLMQATIVDYMATSGYVMLVGLRVPVAVLGRFRIAQRLVEVLQEIAFTPANKVFMPVFVSVRADAARHYAVAREMLDVLAMAVCFAAAVCGAAAHPIVLLMFGPQWASAAPVFAILTLATPVVALYSMINPLLTAAGRPRIVAVFAWINVASVLLAAWFVAPYGLVPLAWALAARGIVGVGLFAAGMAIGLKRSPWPLLRMLALPLVALAAARLGTASILHVWQHLALLPELIVASGVSSAIFLTVVAAMAPSRLTGMARRLHLALLARRPA